VIPKKDQQQAATNTILFLYIPRNDELLSYGGIVEDGLFKIRKSMNLQEVVWKLALFEPRINLAVLVKVYVGEQISRVSLLILLPHYTSQIVHHCVHAKGYIQQNGESGSFNPFCIEG